MKTILNHYVQTAMLCAISECFLECVAFPDIHQDIEYGAFNQASNINPDKCNLEFLSFSAQKTMVLTTMGLE